MSYVCSACHHAGRGNAGTDGGKQPGTSPQFGTSEHRDRGASNKNAIGRLNAGRPDPSIFQPRLKANNAVVNQFLTKAAILANTVKRADTILESAQLIEWGKHKAQNQPDIVEYEVSPLRYGMGFEVSPSESAKNGWKRIRTRSDESFGFRRGDGPILIGTNERLLKARTDP